MIDSHIPFLLALSFRFCVLMFRPWPSLDFYSQYPSYAYLFYSVPFNMPYAAGICEQRNLRSSRILEMASVASAVLENMKEEVMCPICLELLVEPQSLDCGHSFCSACITGNYKSSVAKNVESRCPVCRISYQLESLRPNRHVANIIERIKELQLNSEEEQKVDLCAQHQEKLLLFCKEDGKLICWLCERSQKHRGHHTFLVEDVVQEYQVRDSYGGNKGQEGHFMGNYAAYGLCYHQKTKACAEIC